MADLREEFAALAHEQWSGWMRYMLLRFDACRNADGTETWTVSAEDAQRWRRQMKTAYVDLSESEKNSDRDEADRMLGIIAAYRQAP